MHRSSSILKILVAALFVAALGVAGAGTAGAQTSDQDCINLVGYEATASIGATPATVTAGTTVTVSGSGFPANYPLTISLNGTVIRQVTTDANGTFSFPYTTTTAEAGRQLRFTTDFCTEALSTTVTVSSTGGGSSTGAGGGNTGTGTSSSLPRTGSDSADLARIGVLLVAGGALAIAATRRRRKDAVTA